MWQLSPIWTRLLAGWKSVSSRGKIGDSCHTYLKLSVVHKNVLWRKTNYCYFFTWKCLLEHRITFLFWKTIIKSQKSDIRTQKQKHPLFNGTLSGKNNNNSEPADLFNTHVNFPAAKTLTKLSRSDMCPLTPSASCSSSLAAVPVGCWLEASSHTRQEHPHEINLARQRHPPFTFLLDLSPHSCLPFSSLLCFFPCHKKTPNFLAESRVCGFHLNIKGCQRWSRIGGVCQQKQHNPIKAHGPLQMDGLIDILKCRWSLECNIYIAPFSIMSTLLSYCKIVILI